MTSHLHNIYAKFLYIFLGSFQYYFKQIILSESTFLLMSTLLIQTNVFFLWVKGFFCLYSAAKIFYKQ